MREIRGIYALCDTSLNPRLSHLELARQLVAGGVPILQLRMKGETDLGKVREVALQILALKRERDFTFLLNDFVALAAELPVDGIHVGQDDLSIAEARKILGPNRLIGYSSHSLEEALAAEAAGADYVALGAIFPTATKGPGHPVQGLETLRRVVAALRAPVIAIGGINRENLSQVLATGVAAVAMIGALSLAPDIAAEARWFVDQFQKRRG
ncbi:thiamine phosphate synthase [Deltaproteobacteria bacterium PRO3]|nr:thiamine phosphate synthase [Deltaproteobacteria bacterium PRO3]